MMLIHASKKIACIEAFKILCFCLSFCLFYFTSSGKEANWLQGTDTPIRGRVTDASSGEPIKGVSITLRGTARGTTTDAAGEFEIAVDEKNVELEFGAINYISQRVKVEQQQFIDVSLQLKANSLGEVVVVGYGRQKRATLTGAVSEVKGADLVKSPSPNVASNLSGRIPGVIASNNSGEPGNDDPNLLIRGVNTFSGSTSPLIVIDGVANRPGGFQRLNPNDIETVTVLKDASAAIYGAQAANGVILVTTKRGRAGATKISASYNQGFNSWVKVPKMVESYQYAILMNEARIYAGDNPVFTDEEIQKFKDGSDPINYPNTNWIKQVVREVTPQSQLNLSLSGGSNKTTYYASFGRVGQSGQFKNSNLYEYSQYNATFNIDAQVVENLKLSFDVQLRYTDRKGPAKGSSFVFGEDNYGSDGSWNVFTGTIFALPIYPAVFPDGRLGATNGSVNTFAHPMATTTGLAGDSRFKSLYSLNTFRYRLDMPWLSKGLYFDGYVSADLENSSVKDFRKSWSVYRYDKNAQDYIEERQTLSDRGLATLQQTAYNSLLFTVNAKLNYQKTLNNVHAINSFVAYEQQQFRDQHLMALRNNFFTDNIDELNYGSAINALNGGNSSNTARRNYFARVNYAYDEKYMIEVQARYDGSDRFSKEKRWGLFPSVSVGWRLDREAWGQNLLHDNEMKIRASYGKLGNDAIDPYQFLQFYNLDATGYYLNGEQVPTISPGVLPNPNFTWETALSYNLAIEGSLLKKRLTYTLEYFDQKRSDVLTRRNATVPSYTGLILPVENIGKMQNRGFEVQMNYAQKVSDLYYSVGYNFTYTKNKVLFMDEPDAVPDYQKQTGRSLNTDIVYITDGLFQSQEEIDKHASYDIGKVPRPGDVKFVDLNNDGVINFFDQKRIEGNYQPTIVYGINGSLNWKNIDFSILFQGQAGTKVHFYPPSSSQNNYYLFLFEGRSTPDKVTDKPTVAGDWFNRPGFNQNTHPFYRRNSSFLRLKNLEVGYTFTNLLNKVSNFDNARVYFNASNLLTFAHFNDVDPETLNRGDGKGYPLLRTVNFGFQLSF